MAVRDATLDDEPIETEPVEIRKLGPADAAALARVLPEVFDGDVQPALAAEFLADARHHLVVAIAGGNVVGMATGVHYIHPDKPAALWVNELGVAPAYRDRGIAKRLMRALFDSGRAVGCSEAWVGTEPDNHAARKVYAAVGGAEQTMVYVTFELGADRAPESRHN